MLNHSRSFKVALPEVHSLITRYVSVALVSASAERSFSAMRRIKTWLRSSMSDTSLNNAMYAHLNKERMDCVDIEGVARTFASANDVRAKYFGVRLTH